MGFHIALSREDSKKVHGAKDDAELQSIVLELTRSPALKKEGLVVESKQAWDPIHRTLTDGELEPTGGEFPLNHAVFGGKHLERGGDFAVVHVRPDMTTFVGDALRDVKEPGFREKYFGLAKFGYSKPLTEKDYADAWRSLQLIRELFEYCSQERMAVIFFVQLR